MRVLVLCLALLATAVLNAGSTYEERNVTDGGVIQGKVVMKSALTAPQLIPVGKDYQKVCGEAKTVPGTVFGKNGEVPNAVVYIERIASGKKRLLTDPIRLDQKSCEYVPHVLIVPAGADVEILNSDPTLHNVHTYNNANPRRGTIFNLAFPVPGQKVKRKIADAGNILSLCDAGHPWMSAHIFIVEHPYYAVTDQGGNFTLDAVPPGNYTLRVWQEGTPRLESNSNTAFLTAKPRELSKPISVKPKQTVTVNFEL